MLATVVVFPTANPPATTIFMGRAGGAGALRAPRSVQEMARRPLMTLMMVSMLCVLSS